VKQNCKKGLTVQTPPHIWPLTGRGAA
jgi:hypothetical protein